MSVSYIPAGYGTVTVYIYVKSSHDALEFYSKAFDATEVLRLNMPDGSIAHAEMKIGNSTIMMSDENPAWGVKGPLSLGGTTFGFCIYVPDCDAAVAKAVAAGATLIEPVADQFYGDRTGKVKDPFGHTWMIATHIEELTPALMQSRMEEWMRANPM